MKRLKFNKNSFGKKKKEKSKDCKMTFFMIFVYLDLIEKRHQVVLLCNQKVLNFNFSINQFLIAADLYEVLVESKDFNIEILKTIIEMLSKENKQDSITYLFQIIKEHDIYSVYQYSKIQAENRQYLIYKISQKVRIVVFGKFFDHLTETENNFTISGYNAINIFVEMQVDLTY
ncbi:unnamed protein product [Paramecium primaurelia]|uniref:Uncharacterized protein n=1 Tax=Paramecium primaurelia TaxID=5886 RepID=A0A8S1LN75_PARPR|nr:unnamed protein product [Paramecium primaurelia]